MAGDGQARDHFAVLGAAATAATAAEEAFPAASTATTSYRCDAFGFGRSQIDVAVVVLISFPSR